MYYTGFADEAGKSLDAQIKATKELGWSRIESRGIDKVNITDLSDAQFEAVFEKLGEAGISINCFGSKVANWSKQPRSEEDFQQSIGELERAIPRMQRLGTQMIRGMSFSVAKDEEPDNPELEKIIFKKVTRLAKMCEDAGVLYVHENCMNYGGLSYEHTLKLIDNVKSDAFTLVFDTGNPISSDDRRGSPPYKKQDVWEFYRNVKEFITYVHIKDGRLIDHPEKPGRKKMQCSFPGEGDGYVREIVADLLKSGYDGGFSIEPHLAVVFHDESIQSSEEVMYQNYVEYGRRFMKIVEAVR